MSVNRGSPEFQTALKIAVSVFYHHYRPGDHRVAEHLDTATEAATKVFGVDPGALRQRLEELVNVVVPRRALLAEQTGHIPWLEQHRDEVGWPFWQRYRDYLQSERLLGPDVVERLDDVSEDILGLLEDPRDRGRAFDRRGLVVGQVQSGKTTNYSALINKAVDAGYKLVIVLAGLYNNLRSQTQLRIDHEVLGFDTAKSALSADDQNALGVGRLREHGVLHVGSLTSWLEGGDFRTDVASGVGIMPGHTPLILVVKKNATVLRNVNSYFIEHSMLAKVDQEGHKYVPDVPLLVIDDEADLASIDTTDVPVDEDGHPIADFEPTTINRLVRRLLHGFAQSAYVGYTATPFANIFIRADRRHSEYGEDLFPRSFIINLRPPSNYIGPRELLGDPDAGTAAMPIKRSAADLDAILPNNHKKWVVFHDLSDSLREALRSFLLAAAARSARGQESEHNSMLIHVTHFQAVQEQMAELVGHELQSLQQQLRFGNEAHDSKSIYSELKLLWERDFEVTSSRMGRIAPAWDSVRPHLEQAAAKTRIRTINGASKDILDYAENRRTGVNLIAVGGNKLSRGLTLEGLTTSYFRRTSRMYDTLMQMGRWFGFRDGYEDLCRIYTTDDLWDWFGVIADASEELRGEFEKMALIKATPLEFGLRVASHPGLLVTSRMKMRDGKKIPVSFNGDISETTVFFRSKDELDSNLAAADHLLASLGAPRPRGGTYLWNTTSSSVLEFLDGYKTHPNAPRADAALLARYIRKQNALSSPELTDWTVALVGLSKKQDLNDAVIAGHHVWCIRRERKRFSRDAVSIQRLLSPGDEGLDLDEKVVAARYEEMVEGLRRDGREDEIPAWKPDDPPAVWLRSVRSPKSGLLLIYPLDRAWLNDGVEEVVVPVLPIGIGVSFPGTKTRTKVYMVNRTWRENELSG